MTPNCSPEGTEPPNTPPILHLFGIEPEAGKTCFNRQIAEIPPTDNFLPRDILKDLQTIRNIRSINGVHSEELRLFQNEETIADIQHLRDRVSLALDRLQVTNNTTKTLSTPPESPVSRPSTAAKSTRDTLPATSHPRNLRTRIRATNRGVVHGTGVVSKRRFKKNEFIALYDGPMVYRIKSRQYKHPQTFYVFKIGQSRGTPVPRFLKKDTFVAWSNIMIKYSGVPGIELGREANGPIRYLNHSKNANVKIHSHIEGRLHFSERKKLQLQVIALKDIAPGEELLFDYDPNQSESEIDFTLSTVEQPDKNKVEAIRLALRKIHQKR